MNQNHFRRARYVPQAMCTAVNIEYVCYATKFTSSTLREPPARIDSTNGCQYDFCLLLVRDSRSLGCWVVILGTNQPLLLSGNKPQEKRPSPRDRNQWRRYNWSAGLLQGNVLFRRKCANVHSELCIPARNHSRISSWAAICRFYTDDESGKKSLSWPARLDGLTPFRNKGIKRLLALTQGLKYKKRHLLGDTTNHQRK